MFPRLNGTRLDWLPKLLAETEGSGMGLDRMRFAAGMVVSGEDSPCLRCSLVTGRDQLPPRALA